jgi:serine/threonine-protein kinase
VAAIKVLAPQLAMSEGFRERFEAEIESLKTLRHDNIVRLFGYGKDQGCLFYAMEIVEGTSLDEQLKSGRRFNWHETVDIALQVCRALKHAHDHGIVHRDIKPANILLDASGHVKIADFGIARLFGGQQLTVAGGVLGTADYMSPEQAEGLIINERCDQYSLGCVMYALLAGRPPFRARSLPEMLQLQRYAQPEPVTRYAPSTPPQLSAAIAQLLEKEPANRFPNILVLSRHLEALRRALTRKEEQDEALVTPQIDYDAALAPTRADARVAASEADEASFDVSPSVDIELHDAAGRSDPTIASHAPRQRHAAAKQDADDLQPEANHFTTVDSDSSGAYSAATITQVLPLAALLLGLLAVASAGVWWLNQPVDASRLFATIEAAAARDNLSSVDAQLREFLSRFPADDRAEDVRAWLRQVDLDRRERRFDLLARRSTSPGDLLPVEGLYLEALRKSQRDADQGLEMLRSLVVVAEGVEDAEDPEDRIAECVALARQKITELESTLADEASQQQGFMRSALAAIERLTASDPAAAKAKATAFVQLYDSKPWADEAVERAKAIVAGDTAGEND